MEVRGCEVTQGSHGPWEVNHVSGYGGCLIIATLHMTLGLNPGAPHRPRPRGTSGCVWGVQGHLAVGSTARQQTEPEGRGLGLNRGSFKLVWGCVCWWGELTAECMR